MPVNIDIAGQRQPLEIMIVAILNSKNLKISTNFIDFGPSTIYESSIAKVVVENPTLLVENFGFLDLPKFLSIRPGLGHGCENRHFEILIRDFQEILHV